MRYAVHVKLYICGDCSHDEVVFLRDTEEEARTLAAAFRAESWPSHYLTYVEVWPVGEVKGAIPDFVQSWKARILGAERKNKPLSSPVSNREREAAEGAPQPQPPKPAVATSEGIITALEAANILEIPLPRVLNLMHSGRLARLDPSTVPSASSMLRRADVVHRRTLMGYGKPSRNG